MLFRFMLLSTAVAALLAAALGAGPAAAGQRENLPPLVIKSTFGADLYRVYCSSCHGMTGKGGSARSELHPAPPDLTILARQNNGVFPRDRVRAAIVFGQKAPGVPAHGTTEMPVWGTIFRGLDPSDAMGEIRVENLVQYIASIQEAEVEGAPD